MTELRQAVQTRVRRPRTPSAPSAPPGRLLSSRERTRMVNRNPRNWSSAPDPESAFRCECARAGCSVRLPLAVERHRRRADRFIVGSAHVDGDVVVGIADRFVIVQQRATRAAAARRAGGSA